MTFVLTGLDIPEKARLVEDTFWTLVGGRERFAETAVALHRCDRDDPATQEEAVAHLRITVKDPDPAKVGRAFANRTIEMALSLVVPQPASAPLGGHFWERLLQAV